MGVTGAREICLGTFPFARSEASSAAHHSRSLSVRARPAAASPVPWPTGLEKDCGGDAPHSWRRVGSGVHVPGCAVGCHACDFTAAGRLPHGSHEVLTRSMATWPYANALKPCDRSRSEPRTVGTFSSRETAIGSLRRRGLGGPSMVLFPTSGQRAEDLVSKTGVCQ
jgi:hypothetical protein